MKSEYVINLNSGYEDKGLKQPAARLSHDANDYAAICGGLCLDQEFCKVQAQRQLAKTLEQIREARIRGARSPAATLKQLAQCLQRIHRYLNLPFVVSIIKNPDTIAPCVSHSLSQKEMLKALWDSWDGKAVIIRVQKVI